MDELSLLEADSTESALTSLPAADFTASLDYIDSLASRRSLTLSRRDLSGITTALSNFDYLSPLLSSKAVPGPEDSGFNVSTDFRPLGDARRFDPEGSFRRPASFSRASSRVIANPVSPRNFPPGFRNPLDPDRNTDDLNRTMADIERRINRRPFARYFSQPSRVVICLKRKIRRNVLHAMGVPGGRVRAPKRNYWSRVIC